MEKRIEQTKTIRKSLKLLANSPDKLHNLYQCDACNQFWQESRAWSWDNKLYLFKVPSTSTQDWLDEPYIRPHELATFNSSVARVLENVSEKSDPCSVNGCPNKAITRSVSCLAHHIQSLQKVRLLPQDPTGRWFPPYDKKPISFKRVM
jgi:hypothetical protein